MSLPDPAYAFSVLHEEVTGRYCSPQRAADNLDKYWSSYSEQRACTVLLLDEVDQLVTRKQNVLYKLLDWPTYPFARLIVVAIANTMDLPERLLPSETAKWNVFPFYRVGCRGCLQIVTDSRRLPSHWLCLTLICRFWFIRVGVSARTAAS